MLFQEKGIKNPFTDNLQDFNRDLMEKFLVYISTQELGIPPEEALFVVSLSNCFSISEANSLIAILFESLNCPACKFDFFCFCRKKNLF